MINLADRQHGVVGRRQLFAAGLARGHVDELLRSGRVLRVSRGVYRIAGSPLTSRAEMMAAALRCGPDARVVGERVLEAQGIRTARSTGPFAVLTRPGRTVTGVDWNWRQDVIGVDGHQADVTGIPSVTPARNLLEAAVGCSDTRLARLVDGCRWFGRLEDAVRLAQQLITHPGAVRLLRSGLVDTAAPESGTERDMVAALDGLGGEPQVWVTDCIRVDLLFRPAGLVVERDPEATHGGPVARQEQSERDAVMEGLGLVVEHVTDEHMRDLAALRRRIAALLRALGTRPHTLRDATDGGSPS